MNQKKNAIRHKKRHEKQEVKKFIEEEKIKMNTPANLDQFEFGFVSDENIDYNKSTLE